MKMAHFPTSPPEAIFYEDNKLYACLAYEPITEGHCVVAWKGDVEDLHLLARQDYEHLMWVVEKTRNALLKTLNLEKVYLLYFDEAKHVHWHLIPRYEEKGFTVLTHKPEKIEDFPMAHTLRDNFNL